MFYHWATELQWTPDELIHKVGSYMWEKCLYLQTLIYLAERAWLSYQSWRGWNLPAFWPSRQFPGFYRTWTESILRSKRFNCARSAVLSPYIASFLSRGRQGKIEETNGGLFFGLFAVVLMRLLMLSSGFFAKSTHIAHLVLQTGTSRAGTIREKLLEF